jgi:hypothetical protein
MGKNNIKFTHEYVDNFFRSKGCILLDEYKNSKTKLKYICKCGNLRETIFGKFKTRKNGCKICSGLEKYDQEYVAKYFEEHGCKLLSIYTGANDVLEYICQCGKHAKTTFSNFKKGQRCKDCGLKKLSDQFKFDIDTVRKVFIDGGCVPLFETYEGYHKPLEYICECGNKSFISLADFKSGKRCWKCRVSRILKTKYKFGKHPCSRQQKHIHNIVGGVLNYPVGNSVLDIAFPENKIYIEFDGSGHDLAVKIGQISKEEFDEKEKRRRYSLYRRGWKEIRIISKRDRVPAPEKIKSIIDYACGILENNSWIVFDIDNNLVKYKNKIESYDYGRLYLIGDVS